MIGYTCLWIKQKIPSEQVHVKDLFAIKSFRHNITIYITSSSNILAELHQNHTVWVQGKKAWDWWEGDETLVSCPEPGVKLASHEKVLYQEFMPNSELSLSKSWLSQASYRSGLPKSDTAIRRVLHMFLDITTCGSFIPCWLFLCIFKAVKKCSTASLKCLIIYILSVNLLSVR